MDRHTFISIWGSMSQLALAIGEKPTTVRNWFMRGSIPSRYDGRLMIAAAVAGRPITPSDIYQLRVAIAPRSDREGAA